jgi:predicted glutamine amidotransferase
MCELMGLSFETPIRADFSLREFSGRGDDNADGWGLGWYPDRSLALVKEPVRWGASRFSRFLEGYRNLLAPIYIAHVRHKTTGGEPTHADTQPFVRELGGVEYCFAHNGTVHRFDDLPMGRYRPVGDTDSERFFCHLMDQIEGRETRLTGPADWAWFHQVLVELNPRGTMNLLFSDGRRLFCYHDAKRHKGLSYRNLVVRHHRKRCFEDSELRIQLGTGSVSQGFVIASQPLSADGWHLFEPGELLVLEAGVFRFSSHRTSAGPAESTPINGTPAFKPTLAP